MKRLQFALHLCLAALLVVSTSVLPHHHHGRVACMVVEQCEQDGQVNDCHTGHAASDERGEDPCTVCASQAIVSIGHRLQDETKLPLLPSALLGDITAAPRNYGVLPCFVGVPYSSTLLRQAHTSVALRAPPAFS